MKPLALTLSILFSLPMICLAIRAAALHWRANRKPKMSCPGCGKPAKFIRDRGFKDGSGLVFTCNSDALCKYHGLYFYPHHHDQDRRAEHRTRREIMRRIIERGSVK